MAFTFKQLGLDKNVEVLRRQLNLSGKRVVDIGCGSMTFSRILDGEGAAVLAIDPDERQAEINRNAKPEPGSGIVFVEAGADAIPATDGSQDGVFFSYSLHHIDASIYDAVFEEVERVLHDKGFVYVIEPIGGPLNDVMKLFHDEETERAAAWDALKNFSKNFGQVSAFEYHSVVEYESWNAFANNFGKRTFNPGYSFEDVCREEVRVAFEANATRTETGYQFPSYKRAVCLQQPTF